VLVQLLVSLALDYVWPSVRFPSAQIVLTTLSRTRFEPDVVCLGSSRFAAGIREAEVRRSIQELVPGVRPPEVFNAALPAGDLISADYMLQQLLRQGMRPALAIIEVNPETLNHYNEWFFFHIHRQLCWDDLPAYFIDICRSHQFNRLAAERLVPLAVHRRQLQNVLLGTLSPTAAMPLAVELQCRAGSGTRAVTPPPATPVNNASWEAILCKSRQTPDAQQLDATQAGVGQAYRWVKKYKVGGASAAALERLLVRCREHNIRPILVAVPVSQAHREAYTPKIEAEFRAYMQQVVQQHACLFVDYRDQVPDALFLDNHHLLPDEGGRYFSRRLAQEVLAPVWRTSSR